MAQSAGWAGLGAGASPTDPRPQSSSHLPGTLPQGLLRPAGSARAQKGQDWHEITHGLAAEGAEDALDPGPGRLGRALGLRVNTGTSHLCGGGRLWTKRGVRPKDSSKPRVCLPQGLACSDSPPQAAMGAFSHTLPCTHTHTCAAQAGFHSTPRHPLPHSPPLQALPSNSSERGPPLPDLLPLFSWGMGADSILPSIMLSSQILSLIWGPLSSFQCPHPYLSLLATILILRGPGPQEVPRKSPKTPESDIAMNPFQMCHFPGV